MAGPAGWNAQAALSAITTTSWTGSAWRFHQRRYEPVDHAGSLLVTGRYHRGLDEFREAEAWPALYLALGPEGALGEVLRHFLELMPQLNEYRLTELSVELAVVIDCRDAKKLGLADVDLLDDHDFTIPQELAAEAIARGVEGMLVPSATGLGANLVVFPRQLHGDSKLVVIGSRDPRLYVPREGA